MSVLLKHVEKGAVVLLPAVSYGCERTDYMA